MSVIYDGRKYRVNKKKGKLALDLKKKKITDINEIKGLSLLSDLNILDLSKNKIKEIKGLENLTNLQKLNLGFNQITEIMGLDNLINLQELDLGNNKIRDLEGLEYLKNLKKLCIRNTRISSKVLKNLGYNYNHILLGIINHPQKIVEYYGDKISPERQKIIKKKVLELGTRFARIEIKEIGEVCGLKLYEKLIVKTVKQMIDNKEIYAQYFDSSRAVAFDQQANTTEIDALLEAYEVWEKKEKDKLGR